MARFSIDKHGVKRYRNANGDLHREDGPAYIHPSGGAVHYLYGAVHGLCIMKNGDKTFAYNGLGCRVDGPYHMCPNGHKKWLQFNGEGRWPKL